ncbi:hydroxyacid dehydrogenase [Acinetobacter baumannii]|uniref:hydroxyacid dehydrogenase n=1 Tax=Acinetobacter baumannii TaxID=470 RepID=UPI002340FE32|nr:hydroxyacid dehydrogenase [Acinetobacter baumannii]MDC4414437.1 hydroxyacid dehydrogenase [Acinetobacter baumannii]MDH2520314.1 hydroxyacid dehydrogenase [Acinetobacter baumannii]MDK2200811.1 hydroxyacid dehydrogenase [Acinetobacter baumannii]
MTIYSDQTLISTPPEPMSKKVVFAAHIMGKTGWDMLASRNDIEVVTFPNTISQESFRDLLRSYPSVHAVILGLTKFGQEELDAAHGLQVVSRLGVGYDAVDVNTLTTHGIPLLIGSNSNALTVAEHTIFFLLNLAKRSVEIDALVREGQWLNRMNYLPNDIFGKKIFIIGFGRIGQKVAALCQALGMEISVYDPYVSIEEITKNRVEWIINLEDGLNQADFISLHCPKTSETIGLINADRLQQVKKGAYLINTARGGIVDETALYKALVSGHLAGAALDVFLPEPPLVTNPLLTLPNVICSPHLAGVTKESVERMASLAVSNVLSVFDSHISAENVINPDFIDYRKSSLCDEKTNLLKVEIS